MGNTWFYIKRNTNSTATRISS